jgi:hypothetical protein
VDEVRKIIETGTTTTPAQDLKQQEPDTTTTAAAGAATNERAQHETMGRRGDGISNGCFVDQKVATDGNGRRKKQHALRHITFFFLLIIDGREKRKNEIRKWERRS